MDARESRTTDASDTPFRRVLVAVDGSDHALEAVRVAARLSRALSARLMLLTVYDAPSNALGEPNYSRALSEALEGAERVVDEAKRVALAAGATSPESEWLGGDPAETIISAARAGGYDMVVVGTRGRRPVTAALLGSVSGRVAAEAGRPVLVVGHGAA